jgi:fructuronate reductase
MALEESMPAMEDPKILNPEDFLKEVLESRFSNPNIPDTPQRIATDTSQKIPVRFGETLKKYSTQQDLDLLTLKFIPFVFAVWIRYLLGKNDDMQPMEISSDPMLVSLQELLEDIRFGGSIVPEEKISKLLNNSEIFGIDLIDSKLSKRVVAHLKHMLSGKDAVRRELQEILKA